MPDVAPVDLEAGGLMLPDICDTLSALESSASCINLAGFAGIQCEQGSGAVLMGSIVAPDCAPITVDSGSSGARNYSLEYLDLAICAPRPPACDARFGWLEKSPLVQRDSVEACASSMPDPSWLEIPPAPVCQPTAAAPGASSSGSGGAASTATPRPVSMPPERVIQDDTTQPRITSAHHGTDGGCRATPGVQHAPWGALAATGLGCSLLLRRRRRRS